MTRLSLILLAAVSLAGCDQIGMGSSSPSTDTNMRSVEIEVGTASDEMIILDSASGDGTAVDTSSAVGPAPPRPVQAAGDTADGADNAAGSAPASGAQNTDDQVIRPPAGGAEPDEAPSPAEK